MKKLLFALLFLPLIGFGQDKSFELGAVFGGSLNSLNGDAFQGSVFDKTSFQPLGGLLVQYNFKNRFSIKSKLLYNIKGGSGDIEITTVDFPDGGIGIYSAQLKLHNIKLPLLAQFNFGKNRWRFFCNTGVYFGYLIKAEQVFEEGAPLEVRNNDSNEIPLESFNRLDFGLKLGGGASFQITERTRIFLESSLDYGLANINKTEKLENGEGVMRTQAITTSIGLTYNFPIKKKVFNGVSTLDCPDYEEPLEDTKEKKKSKWRLVLYKDGKKVGGKSKKGKSRLFKKKN